jgi:hypothetical protein
VVLVVAALKAAVTPVGNPVAVSETLGLTPFAPATAMVLLALAPAESVRLAGDDERVKAGVETVNAMVVLPVRLPEIPLTVTVQAPATALLPAVNVRVLLLLELGELNDAVTPAGSPETARLTLPLKPS